MSYGSNAAKVDLAPVFADNMVLQQQSDAALWGKARPGAKPSVPIRSCNPTRTKSLESQDECEAKWYVHNPEGVSEASATAYFFARKLYDPVGIINVSYTQIDPYKYEDANLPHADYMV